MLARFKNFHQSCLRAGWPLEVIAIMVISTPIILNLPNIVEWILHL